MEIARNTMKRLLEELGAKRVSKDAAEELSKEVEETITKIVRLALEYARHAGRKTINKEDIKRAIRDFNGRF